MIRQSLDSSHGQMQLVCPQPVPVDRRSKPHPNALLKCPRCESLDTKFCYYNNYSLTQPRYFCKNCKRYWTDGGSLRNVPVGGGLRKNKRSKQKSIGQADVAVSKPGSLSVDESAIVEQPLSASVNEVSSTGDATNLGYSDACVIGNYPRIENQCGYEVGDQLHRNSTLPHLRFGGEVRNAARFYPSYDGRYALSEEGLAQYGSANYGSNLVDQRTLGREDVPNVHEEKASYSSESSEQQCHRSNQQLWNSLRPNEGTDEERQSFAKTRKLVPFSNEFDFAGKPISKPGNQDVACGEANGGLVNPYDWQQISEGLFNGSLGDFLYLPEGSWTDWSHFDTGTG